MSPKPPKAKLSVQDSELFRKAMADAKPITTKSNRHVHRPCPQLPVPGLQHHSEKLTQADLVSHSEDLLELRTNEQLLFLRAGLHKQVLRKLSRGQYPVEDELDLHGFSQSEAEKYILQFINDSTHRQLRCIRIIHGKGLRSGHDKPILKNLCNYLLRRLPDVLAFVSAKPASGGTGAVCVLLKTKPGIETDTHGLNL